MGKRNLKIMRKKNRRRKKEREERRANGTIQPGGSQDFGEPTSNLPQFKKGDRLGGFSERRRTWW